MKPQGDQAPVWGFSQRPGNAGAVPAQLTVRVEPGFAALLDLILRTRGRVQTSCLDLAMASVRLPPAEERR